MPSRSPFAIRLTVQERAELEARCKEYTLPHRDVAPLAWPNATARRGPGRGMRTGCPTWRPAFETKSRTPPAFGPAAGSGGRNRLGHELGSH